METSTASTKPFAPLAIFCDGTFCDVVTSAQEAVRAIYDDGQQCVAQHTDDGWQIVVRDGGAVVSTVGYRNFSETEAEAWDAAWLICLGCSNWGFGDDNQFETLETCRHYAAGNDMDADDPRIEEYKKAKLAIEKALVERSF